MFTIAFEVQVETAIDSTVKHLSCCTMTLLIPPDDICNVKSRLALSFSKFDYSIRVASYCFSWTANTILNLNTITLPRYRFFC
jgi:hypothetical protein